MMLEILASRFAASVSPAVEAATTRQGLAKVLRQAARPLVILARPRTDEDRERLDALVASALANANINPNGPVGSFARARAREVAMLPWQVGFFSAAAAALPEQVNAESAFTENGNTASMTHGFTCAVSPGSNRLLAAFVTSRDDTFPTNAVVAYNGTTMALATSRVYTGSTPDRAVYIYYLLGADIPNDGASHDFTIDVDANFAKVLLAEYINVSQGTPEDTDTSLLTNGDASVTLTVSNGALLLDCWITTNLSISPTFGTDQDKLGEGLGGAGSAACSQKLPDAHSGGSVDMSVTSTGTNGAYCAAAWAPAA